MPPYTRVHDSEADKTRQPREVEEESMVIKRNRELDRLTWNKTMDHYPRMSIHWEMSTSHELKSLHSLLIRLSVATGLAALLTSFFGTGVVGLEAAARGLATLGRDFPLEQILSTSLGSNW